MYKNILEIKSVSKSFFGVKVLKNVSLGIREGEVHALLGENGAGKTTLVKILSGVYSKDKGSIKLNGKECCFRSPSDAYNRGIGIVFQSSSLVNGFTVLENVFLGMEPRTKIGIINKKGMLKSYKNLCDRIGWNLSPKVLIEKLSLAERKIVEVMKCLVRDSRIVIMDEPTDSLTKKESNIVFSVIRDLKRNNISVIYITHYLEEVFQIADRATVLKDGGKIGTVNIRKTDTPTLVDMVVGKDFKNELRNSKSQNTKNSEILRVEEVVYKKKLKGVSFSVSRGEVFGVTGLIGAGKTELAMVLFGALKPDMGSIYLNNKKVAFSSPKEGKKSGMGLLTEDRDHLGLIHNLSIIENYTLPSLKKHEKRGFISSASEKSSFNSSTRNLKLRLTSAEQKIETLSGGNKQKIVIGKWLETNPEILIMDEPTRGVDMKSKSLLYRTIRQLTGEGKTVVFLSTDIEELVGISDRIMVLSKGVVQAIFSRGVTEEKVYEIVFGGNNSAVF